MEDKPENLQAFPTGDPAHGGHEGMTLRDWFAGQALAGMLATGCSIDIAGDHPGQQVAGVTYILADAMLAARAKRN